MGPKFESEREILLQISQGLAHLHGLGIVHRDLKPVNILLFVPLSKENECKSPIIKLADFGRSKITHEEHTETSNSNPTGTRGWMAPEVYITKKVDSKVDVFALGLIFDYTLSGGKHPFGDDDLEERVMRIKKKEPMKMVRNYLKEPYSSENNEAFDLIKSMLVMNPDKRPTVNEISNSLFFPVKKDFLKLLLFWHFNFFFIYNFHRKIVKSCLKE